ncbi:MULTISPECIES: Asp23/Gls24 family envelope stress response protein [unclassified Frankia]
MTETRAAGGQTAEGRSAGGGVPTEPGGGPAGLSEPPPDRLNRVALVGVGLLCLAAGVLALLVGAGAFGDGVADEAVLDADTRSYPTSHTWFWLAVGIGSGLVVLLALGWLRAQTALAARRRGLYVTDDALGGVHLSAAALTDAVEDDVFGIAGVEAVRAVLRGRREPVLEIAVTVVPGPGVAGVLDDIRGPVLHRARTAVGRPRLPAKVEVRPAATIRPQVR